MIRERLELAALAIAAAPDRWKEIAAATRSAAGASRDLGATSASVQFLVTCSSEKKQVLPIEALEQIGCGGLNTVYRTRDCIFQLPFIVRQPRQARSAAELEFFLRHDRIIEERMRTLPWHPVIPVCVGRMKTSESHYEVYEYAPGINLRSYVASRGLTTAAILDIAFSAARGLQHLHAHGLIHADLKPENFCVEERTLPNGRRQICVWIIDFDMVTTPEELAAEIAAGTFSGTPGYIPPETFSTIVPAEKEEQERMAFAKDVYALGVSLCQILGDEVSDLPSSHQSPSSPWSGRPLVGPWRLPGSLPLPFRELVCALCTEEWRLRPAASEVAASLRSMRKRVDRSSSAVLIVKPSSRKMVPRFEEALAHGPSLGPYLVVNPDYVVREVADGQPGRIMEIQDIHGRRLLAIAFTFKSLHAADAFYEGRRRLLAGLNRVRKAHPALFWGTFSDLVRTQDGPEGPFQVWFIRPLLPEAVDLEVFLQKEADLSLKERVAILRRITDALTALEEAGYTYTGIEARSVFFVPYPSTEIEATLPFQNRRLFDVRASRPYHQELMNMAAVGPISRVEDSYQAVADILSLAAELDVPAQLPGDCLDFLEQLPDAGTWDERAALFRWIEQHCELATLG